MDLAPEHEGTERLPPGQSAHPATGGPRLLIVSPDGACAAIALPSPGSISIGRDPLADVRLEERAVSRHHARLEIDEHGRTWLRDLGSANGSLVGGELVRDARVSVDAGAPIAIGRSVLTVQQPPSSSLSDAPRPAIAASRTSKAMAEVEELVRRAAPTLMSVLLLGETGAGKDVAAERIHHLSTRAAGPLVRINCAGLSAALLESELFGHERGAFTGAVQAKPGLLEVAAGGTVFLDEIGEMPLEVQAKLLLAIEQRVTRRVGATRSLPIDVRFISATHRDLEEEIRRERFRADFYYRINGLTIRVPPLRQRSDELLELAAQFAGEAAARLGRAAPPHLDEAARRRLQHHDWPGNVRELRSVIERAVLLADGDVISPALLGVAGLPAVPSPRDDDAAITQPIALEEIGSASAPPPPQQDLERERVVAALAACGGNQSRAARVLGISRNTLIARIRQFGLARPHRQDEVG